jgi:hypothetical protein|tara:strand:- start:256 stop:558 length:303 start_codon:yes stop_codon:yes gene_type:complete
MTKALIVIEPQSIPYLREDKLRREVYSLENKKSAILRNSEKSRSKDDSRTIARLELEVCYLQRELEIRESRKLAHTAFLQKKQKRAPHRDNRARRPRNVV